MDTEIDGKLFNLLKTCLWSLSVLFEILRFTNESESLKLVQEVILYLTTFLDIMPLESVKCVKHLLKYTFSVNFVSLQDKYELFTEDRLKEMAIKDIFEHFKVIREYGGAATVVNSEGSPTVSTVIGLMSVLGTAATEDKKPPTLQGNIKMFESIVIQSLKVCQKSNEISTLDDRLCFLVAIHKNQFKCAIIDSGCAMPNTGIGCQLQFA